MNTWFRIAAAIVIFASGWMVNGWRLNAGMEMERTSFAQAQRDAKDSALKESEENRHRERQWQDKVKGQQDALVALYNASDRALRSLIAERDRLRNDINQFAAGPSDPAADSIAACRADAATLGDVLADALQREEDVTAAAETHAASTRSLLNSWPK